MGNMQERGRLNLLVGEKAKEGGGFKQKEIIFEILSMKEGGTSCPPL